MNQGTDRAMAAFRFRGGDLIARCPPKFASDTSMSLKEILLKEGWAGKTLSRPETVERLNPVIRAHITLNLAYEYAIRHLSDRDIAERIRGYQRKARMDVGKLSESVLSAGGVSYNGTDLEPDDVALGTDDDTILFNVLDEEEALRNLLALELKQEHQIRSRGVMRAVENNVLERLSFLNDVTRRRVRPKEAVGPKAPGL